MRERIERFPLLYCSKNIIWKISLYFVAHRKEDKNFQDYEENTP